MTNDSRTPQEIEREIEAQRSDLTSNLEDLQDKFSIDTVVRQIGDQFREHGGDMGRSISEQVKANPIPLALTGIGLAWMMFGNSQKSSGDNILRDDGLRSANRDIRQSHAEQGRRYAQPSPYTSQRHDGPAWSQDDEWDDGYSTADRMSDGIATAKDKAANSADAIKDRASAVASTVSDGAATAGSKISDVAASTQSALASGSKSVQAGLSVDGNRIAEGTETLTEEGRKRVIAARKKAIELRRQTARSMNDGADMAADFYDRQPLVVGALALAVGAALGGALPRTKTEDDLIGHQSDSLFDEAEQIFEEEKSKAMAVAKSVQDKVKDIAAETKADLNRAAPGDKSAVEAVSDKAKSMVGRVTDTAKRTAKDENLGKPKS